MIVRDPISGLIDYEWMPFFGDNAVFVASATDYDLAGEHPWAAYSIRNDFYVSGTVDTFRLYDVDMLMDDGSRFILNLRYLNDRLDFRPDLPSSVTYTHLDPLGRTLSIDHTNLKTIAEFVFEEQYDFRQQGTVYDPASGQVDYISTLHHDGRRESIDYDVSTGQRDYLFTQWEDGSMLGEDYNPANGVLDYRRYVGTDGSSLDEDYDSQGRLNYVVERLADGQMRVTDYDLLNEHAWASYSILYAAGGQIVSVAVL
ncbi:hypothetical protein [Falsiroseomonas selenitidurans]|uniref:Uncharacterized protein n=1 Tax=Falsiroseomonas selenitidurans TaxID=2716335 RepID=A0ABX1E4K0_9PROT|nr:hypothetical protein [Falsiroseomonas selenitidurans]NKC31926.1 hypothetical protein [Falsiroseomonas selenitidurans]